MAAPELFLFDERPARAEAVRAAAAEAAEHDAGFNIPACWSRPRLTRLRWQLPLTILLTAVLPALLLQLPEFWTIGNTTSASNTFFLVMVCGIVALLLFRRLEEFPGIWTFAQVAPSVAAPYGMGFAAILILRLEYSRPLLLLSAASCLLLLGALWFYYRRRSLATVYLLPGAELSPSPRLRLHPLSVPSQQIAPNSLIAADLNADLDRSWQRFLLRAALAGIPVYDAKALEEAATGRVEIGHLSENTFGSVLPSLPYLRVKRVADLALAIALLPLVAVVTGVVATAIKLDSRGNVFFKQPRVGFRGQSFVMLKFRTMRHPTKIGDSVDPVTQAITEDGDGRVTRVGRFLRRHRIDELPQIFNILKGEMSWIGPRPEAEALASWYEIQIPFYGYRHMVRPGITGWAQVNQGHVTEVNAIRDKLNYDFFYIKNFSAWLDALIAARTLRILLLGKGAR